MRNYYNFNYGSPPGYAEQATFNFILSNEDDTESQTIKRTRLIEGDKEKTKFGDNEVTHYKMTVVYTPEIESTVPDIKMNSYVYFEYEGSYRGHTYIRSEMYDGRGGVNHLDYYRESSERWPDGYSKGYTTASHYRMEFTWNPSLRSFETKRYYRSEYIRAYTPGASYGLSADNPQGYQPPYYLVGAIERIIWRKVALPYYWIDHFNEVMAQESDYHDSGALSECIRNTIQEQTTYDTNGFANILSFLEMLKDAKNLAIADVIKEAKPLWKTILQATGNAVEDLSDTKACQKAARKALRKKAVSTAANAWLSYRYVYNTTKADYEQFVRAKVGEYLGQLDQNRVLRGSIDLSAGTLKIKMRLTDNTRPNFEKFLISGNQYGVFPGLYNLWDMVPFSFIADWFAPLGDELQDIDQSIFFRYYEVNELLVSRKLRYEKDQPWGHTTYEYYERRQLDSMPQWEIYEDPKEASGKTIAKRCLDGISIISGFAM